ncbi:phosphate ABC transporter membrane protein 1, PhoT family [Rhizobium sp. RU35A]|uniref:phosphate ABC transporter permease subunit PstC n=1 Tax=Rhizobium sp. RU35A TaxID=1907414 RepID=UPI00095435C9|nr:phosphate ABC transporter permease subunit PstC [Rhizobium sp. RU35A]SIR14717.1 phosphate ABC transporter membrane protein 1, PhoT family [Rhizobium sp. RU35A]
MNVGIIILVVLAFAAAGYIAGKRQALSLSAQSGIKLHSLSGYYGQTVALFAAVPALLLLIVWLLVQPIVVESRVGGMIPDSAIAQGSARSLVMSDVRRIAGGLDAVLARGGLGEDELNTISANTQTVRARLAEVGVALAGEVQPVVFEAARAYRQTTKGGALAMTIAVLGVSLALAFLAYRRIEPQMRARNISEGFVKSLLIASSLIAILTTIGIVFSLVFETITFFKIYPASQFFFSTVWNPQFRGGSELGILPLLWGTMYVSFIALLVAVPIGLMIAIYLSEYAGRSMRSFAKPAIEMLAGIPTIVYGLFALVTIGPFLRDYFAQPLGLGSSSSSVLTAGLVMGVMIIPFVSSLSDDIINAVPQALRDGSYGLGATRSETIKKVVMPAALPGIVGAVLLAASRAIGETMIVVLGAGASAKLSLNPFEAMTTVTVKIVSQLTGDSEFSSPETLVAFALGLTLFTFTLALNVLALYIVRKYREQYE